MVSRQTKRGGVKARKPRWPDLVIGVDGHVNFVARFRRGRGGVSFVWQPGREFSEERPRFTSISTYPSIDAAREWARTTLTMQIMKGEPQC